MYPSARRSWIYFATGEGLRGIRAMGASLERRPPRAIEKAGWNLKERFVATLMPHVADRYRNSMRYFGLLAPRSKKMLSIVFMLLRQKRRPRPFRLSWADLRYQTFGTDPLVDSRGERMVRVGRLNPAIA
jgi:hypothetical protein